MNTKTIYLYNDKYIQDKKILEDTILQFNKILNINDDDYEIIEGKDEKEICVDSLTAIILTGATQAKLIELSNQAKIINIVFSYNINGIDEKQKSELLKGNSAPAIMDCLGYLKSTDKIVLTSLTLEQTKQNMKLLNAYSKIKGSTILQIGNKENWVVSVDDNNERYEKYGINIKSILQQDLIDMYCQKNDYDNLIFSKYDSLKLEDRTKSDLQNAVKMASCMKELLSKNNSDGISIACFDVLRSGTNACVGASYINGFTDKFVSCEGDLDSAMTMLFVRNICDNKFFMANPVVLNEESVNFSHCTAPINLCKNTKCKLMSHHESGIGISPKVEIEEDQVVTLCRISALTNKATVIKTKTMKNVDLDVCRTQTTVKLDTNQYLNSILGCHQLIVFGDIEEEFKKLCLMFNLEVN